jgi:hypothetical protein
VRHHSEAFVGIDTSKSHDAVAIAKGGRGGEVRYLGVFPTNERAAPHNGVELARSRRICSRAERI